MSNSKKKKENIFVAYFKPFGIKQACDIIMIISAILMVVGAFVNETLLLVGLLVFMAADLTMLIKHILVLASKINHRSPEYRRAFVDTIITGAMLLIAVLALVYFFAR